MKRKTLKKLTWFLLLLPVAAFAFVWAYANFFVTIDTAEIDRYYDALSAKTVAGRERPLLVLDLGIKEDDGLQVIIDRLKYVMGLGEYEIWVEHKSEEMPPAQIKDLGNGIMGIYIANNVKEKREKINIMIHELGHIFEWNIHDELPEGCDVEKVTDCIGMNMGLGILVLNGLTDNIFFIPGGEYKQEKKFYGYLGPDKFGYLLARYAQENGIPYENITPFLGSTGRKYFDMGCRYIARNKLTFKKYPSGAEGLYWCSRCGTAVSLDVTKNIKGSKCPKCSLEL